MQLKLKASVPKYIVIWDTPWNSNLKIVNWRDNLSTTKSLNSTKLRQVFCIEFEKKISMFIKKQTKKKKKKKGIKQNFYRLK